VFGEEHPYGRAVRHEDYTGIGREMLQQFHSSYYRQNVMTLFASGRIESDSVSLINKHFGTAGLPGRAETYPPALEEKDECTRDRIIKKGAIQSAIRIGSRTINKRHPDYFGLKILDTVLGGYFGSRLMKNIREEKGYTYGIHSSIRSYRLSGYKSISAEVGSDHTDEATREIYKEIIMLQNEPVKKAELDAVKNYMLGELLRMFDGPFATLESFRSAWEFGMDNTYYNRFAETIKSIGSDEIISLARTYYKTEDLIEVTAGPE
jgi:predicted Zn-dependent peptidase